jgi:mannose-6-phosphate isomerase-like protein (cupin superfamily)
MSDWNHFSVQTGLDGALGADLLVAPDENGEGLAVVEHTLPPKTLAAPLHRHENEDEISFVLRGTMGVREGEAVSTVDAGECAVKERGVWHTFWNAGSEPLRFLEIVSPGGFARYFRESARLLAEEDLDESARRARFEALHDRYDFELDPESVPELRERHGLRG